jgi:glutamate synthase domain-containing protein 3
VVEGTGDHCCEYMTGGTVVVLGKVGRNFAAGMSGGIAYVLDEDGKFAQYCNTSMVSLGPISKTVKPGQHMGTADTDILHGMLTRHVELTESPKAQTILKDWDNFYSKFVKVTPSDYYRALLEIENTAKVA